MRLTPALVLLAGVTVNLLAREVHLIAFLNNHLVNSFSYLVKTH